MKKKIEVNTTSIIPTCFLSGAQLITYSREKFHVPSENWPYPTAFKIGDPRDRYYAEIWGDGMDWQITYWIIESVIYSDPIAIPLIMFDDHSIREKFVECYFKEFINGILWFRRNQMWIKERNLGVYDDSVWPFVDVYQLEQHPQISELFFGEMSHASQPLVNFWINSDFVPDRILRNKTEKQYEQKELG